MLEGMRIVSFCHYLQGPASTQYLADMGADVIKVEAIGGAYERHWSGASVFVEDVSAFFLCANRNKRVIALDLKSLEGLDIAQKLINGADAVVENFRPGVLDRLGLGYEAVKVRKPDIIYASASGFGGSGPMRDMPGQDLMIQARTGLVAASAGGATAVGAAICDQHGGALLAMGILGAYIKRMKTGKGTRVEGNLFNAGIDLQAEAITNYLTAEKNASVFGRDEHLATWFHQAPYGIYRTADDKPVAISLNNPSVFAEALDDNGLRELAQCNPYEERDAYARATAAAVKRHSLAALSAALDAKHMWWAPVHDYSDLRENPQAIHNRVFETVDIKSGQAMLINHPIRYDGATPPVRHLAIEIGHDTREILEELGYGDSGIRSLADAGVISGRGISQTAASA
ncbi:CaiB/BaiF CoA-transferase family protein [Caballeronia sp. GAFFF2]|uniref:CaiB/BaiF CoA transferase family protein n=1 Tax=Caballeronia sp. GAFFF2 TaxID=2921741 RepID=UPI0020298424|nr:CaiB/BaiF CoA-transferase family protein [Caballeronia sp. GAFFF2]